MKTSFMQKFLEKYANSKEPSWTRTSNFISEEVGWEYSGLYCALFDMAHKNTKSEHIADAKHKQLARKGHKSISTIKRMLDVLEELGLLKRVRHSKSCEYILVPLLSDKGQWKYRTRPERKRDATATKQYGQTNMSDNQYGRSYGRKKKRYKTPEEIAEIDEYLTVINRFRFDDDDTCPSGT